MYVGVGADVYAHTLKMEAATTQTTGCSYNISGVDL